MMNLSYNGTINNQWETLCEKVYKTSIDTLGHTTRKHQVWFDDNDAEMLSLPEERRRTHDAFFSQQTRNRILRYTQAKSKLQKQLRAIQNAWWEDSSLQSNRSMVHTKLLLRFHSYSQRNQQLRLGVGNISATY